LKSGQRGFPLRVVLSGDSRFKRGLPSLPYQAIRHASPSHGRRTEQRSRTIWFKLVIRIEKKKPLSARHLRPEIACAGNTAVRHAPVTDFSSEAPTDCSGIIGASVINDDHLFRA